MTPDSSLVVAGVIESQSSVAPMHRWQLRPATITVAGLESVMGAFDGEGFQGTAPTVNVPMISLVGWLGVGARVMVMTVPPNGNYVIGPGSRFGDSTTINVDMAAGATASSGGGYNPIPGVSIDFTKRFTDSRIKVTLMGSAYSTIISTALDAGVRIDGSDYSVTEFSYNVATTHLSWGGMRDDMVDNLPTGLYTIEAVWAQTGGAGTLIMDSADRISLNLQEVSAPA